MGYSEVIITENLKLGDENLTKAFKNNRKISKINETYKVFLLVDNEEFNKEE